MGVRGHRSMVLRYAHLQAPQHAYKNKQNSRLEAQ
jgi:hypothetical protein